MSLLVAKDMGYLASAHAASVPGPKWHTGNIFLDNLVPFPHLSLFSLSMMPPFFQPALVKCLQIPPKCRAVNRGRILPLCVVGSREGKVASWGAGADHVEGDGCPWPGVGRDAKAPFPLGFPPPQTIPGAVNPVAGAAARRSEGRPAPSTTPAPVRRASSLKSLAWTPSGTRDTLGPKPPAPWEEAPQTPGKPEAARKRETGRRRPRAGGCQLFGRGLCIRPGAPPTLHHVRR